ncbi:putative queuine tRNA-ribosyltransferase-like protein [Coleophoma crateriformis]|uniref:Queuine tRNA-ribosyltransferase accessory subunit 2 n=1 Tax=Coleophoma crateriformis TaxID=565419 RepID=A0A3D8T946_9HELO|nr:putative queuine tRNA-ribosyltransferase-like protein [Coleophoma crateriformis]
MAVIGNGDAANNQSCVFEVLSAVDSDTGGARIGRLAVQGRKELNTPDFLAVSSRGVVPHLTPDVLASHTHFSGVHMALEDYIEKTGNGKKQPPILSCGGNISPLHAFTAMPTHIMSLLTPRRTPAVSAPVANSKTSIALFTSTGFQPLTNADYIEAIRTLKPDIAIALGDIPYGVKTGVKRTARMGDRTEQWLSELLGSKIAEQAVFASILPIDFNRQAEYIDYLLDEAASDIAGLAFYDSNLITEIPAATSISNLPRLSLDEPSSPHHILRQISLGMDIFTVPFIGFATDGGIALTFRFPQPFPDDFDQVVEGTTAASLGIDMWMPSHAISLLPFAKDCACYACTFHHRAYVQHLLSAKEMLGWILLQIHNHHTMSCFFASIRESIAKGIFDEDCIAFAKAYESELPEKSGQGPRARGYHFKTEGPGESKKNKAAWGDLGSEEKAAVAYSALVPDDGAHELENKGFAEVAE